jgi:VCBS repeat protein/flagellar hook capping protein FlgD
MIRERQRGGRRPRRLRGHGEDRHVESLNRVLHRETIAHKQRFALAPAGSCLQAFILGLLAVTPQTPSAEPLFAAPFLSFDAGSAPYSLGIGDLNGDGRLDLAVANFSSHTVSVLLGNGDGTFAPKTDFGVRGYPRSVAIGDLNGDGRPDLAVANACCYVVSVLLGNGDGTFGPRSDFETGGQAISVAIGDLDGDRRPDLAVANHSSDTVSVLLGKGDGTFGSNSDFETGYHPNSVAIGDLNGDGQPDLAVANGGFSLDWSTVSVLLGNGDGTFGPKTDFITGPDASSVAIGDLNGDARLDLAVASGTSHAVSVLLGNGDGTFGPKSDFRSGFVPSSVAIGELNGDGRPDLAVANNGYGTHTVSVLLGNGDGTFQPRTAFRTGRYPICVAIGDVNRDGQADLVVANSDAITVSVLLGNGKGGFGSNIELVTGEHPVSLATGDLNADARPDLVVANWGDDTVSVLLESTGGAFEPKSDFGTGNQPVSVAIGELNGDGRPDLAVANYGSNTVSVLLGSGDGTFGTKTDFVAGRELNSVAIGDLNRDGWSDLAVANFGSNAISVLLGSGDGTLGTKTDFGTGYCVCVATADFNVDGSLDLAAANWDRDGTVSVLLGNGDGTFGPKTDFETGSLPGSIAVGDLNGDGQPDLAVANWSYETPYPDGTVSVLLGNGDGTFRPKTDFETGGNPSSVAVGDLNGDRQPDLAVANWGSFTVSVLLAKGDGSFAPKADFGTGIEPRSVAIEDLNGDGWADLAVANGASNTISVLFNRGGITPVDVEKLEAVAFDGRVQLHWRLSAEARRDLQGIAVQRATAAEGPYVLCSAARLQPAIEMSFEDAGLGSGSYWYRLVLIGQDGSRVFAGPVSVQVGSSRPVLTALHQPFELADGGPIQIRYSLARAQVHVRLAIYDVRGRVVWSSERSERQPGEHTQTWDRRARSGTLAPRGVYFVGLEAGGMRDSKKLTLVHR